MSCLPFIFHDRCWFQLFISIRASCFELMMKHLFSCLVLLQILPLRRAAFNLFLFSSSCLHIHVMYISETFHSFSQIWIILLLFLAWMLLMQTQPVVYWTKGSCFFFFFTMLPFLSPGVPWLYLTCRTAVIFVKRDQGRCFNNRQHFLLFFSNRKGQSEPSRLVHRNKEWPGALLSCCEVRLLDKNRHLDRSSQKRMMKGRWRNWQNQAFLDRLNVVIELYVQLLSTLQNDVKPHKS